MIERIGINKRYAQAVVANGTVYIAGQIADDADADIRGQTAQVLAKIDALLRQANTSKDKLLSCTVWIRDFADYAAYNEVWEAWVDGQAVPARASVGATLLDPRLRIEIAAIALC